VTIQDLDLRHGFDDLKAIVGLFSQRISEQVKLLKEGKLG